jgi:hypothetical protein
MFERMIFDLVFPKAEFPDEDNRICTESAENVLDAIKGTTRRKVDKRRALYEYLHGKLSERNHLVGTADLPLDSAISTEEWALFLQGVFFTTGVVQLAEGMAHISLALAQHPEVMQKLQNNPDDDVYLSHVITEVLRVWPLFGIAHRISTDDIHISDSVTLPKGSVLCFNYPKYHQTGFQDPEVFRPERWYELKERNCNYLPFGPPNNRPCPGKRLSLVWLKAVTRIMVQQTQLHSCAEHTRSLPLGGHILMVPRSDTSGKTAASETKNSSVASSFHISLCMVFMRMYLAVASVTGTVVQAANEILMLRESKDLKLAQTYFAHYGDDVANAHKPDLSNQLYH